MRVSVGISMTEQTRDRLDEMADTLGMKRSAYVSWLINSAWNASEKNDYNAILEELAGLLKEADNDGEN